MNVLGLTVQIVSAHVSKNKVVPDELPSLILDVFHTLSTVWRQPPQADKPHPAVSIKKSVFPNHIVCLEDSRKLKMLKRHLNTAFKMPPDQCRERWGLPGDYPMVAPNYTKHCSTLVKKMGLGTKPRGRG